MPGPNSGGGRLATEALMTLPRDIESPAGMPQRSPRFDELTVSGTFRRRAGRTTLKQPRRGDGTVIPKSEMTSQTHAIKHLVPESRRPKADLARWHDDEHAQVRGLASECGAGGGGTAGYCTCRPSAVWLA